jgi:hypothetical protein
MSLTLSGDSPKISADGTGVITSGTAVTASGTQVNFTDIPSWVKRITVMFSGVSTNGSSLVQLQLGTSGGIQTTTYLGSGSTSTTQSTMTTGFYIGGGAAASLMNGTFTIALLESSNGTWAGMGIACVSNVGQLNLGSGSKVLSGTLDRIRITTVNGTDTFDAGSINILYE